MEGQQFWDALFLRAELLKRVPEWFRAWATIALLFAVGTLIVCIPIICVLLLRLGWDALFTAQPAYQEATRNFLLAFASAFGAPFLVWRTWVAHQQARAAAEQARIALENHFTSIFSKAVELLGSVRETQLIDGNGLLSKLSGPNLEARLGALYSLERLLHESYKDQRAILETLCAYVRQNSAAPSAKPDSMLERAKDPPQQSKRVDVQAALTIIGRRPKSTLAAGEISRPRLDLRNANLISYDLSGLSFNRSDFSNSFLDEADLRRSSFADSKLSNTFLRSAKMQDADFSLSEFANCDLGRAEIDNANFTSAVLINADLRAASGKNINVCGANLERAFGPTLEYAVNDALSSNPVGFYGTELIRTVEFFRRARHDEQTIISDSVIIAIDIMGGLGPAEDQERQAT